jgi:predicted nucleotidyltransferase
MSEHPLLHADKILRTLVDARVRFVLIGGLASQVHGSPSLTGDVDICFALDGENLRRLSDALTEMTAVRRDLEDGVHAPIDHRALRAGDVFTLSTRYGDLDLLAHPDPQLDFESLLERSIAAEILGIEVRVASLDDMISMKRAAGRPKDRIELEILGALREELDRRPG